MFEIYPFENFPSLCLRAINAGTGSYPSSRIQKGLVLSLAGRDLAEEGVGFGLPIIKVGFESVFPGSGRMSAERLHGFCKIKADFEMNLITRMVRQGHLIERRTFYRVRETFSKIHRNHPGLRKSISILSDELKNALALEDVFCRISTLGSVSAVYTIRDSEIYVDVRFPAIDGCSELIVLNE